ncbi:MAG TPA: segregation/condensation protein A [Syntrophales bacterium]|nr:segregation/condensation protein A [Syntrophales bacterium]HOX94684.1 segregation/condensation protein A [Syntrophales bacterium]HPI55775.1 segregation/condensation protein A [Syntrophales bacterium]HPN23733.1 segregation/condensation protein A [Syntrophales bacterium]HQM27741.1 segregation/condensation protein A [Syntrophales bacterium]
MSYAIKLDIFEGPLDLLLYLIKKNEVDIYNIPIAVITEQYLNHLELMRSMNLDLAGEYLVLAATLLNIKSKMLLPPEETEEGEEEQPDPRAELVRQLLEYQTFKEAALDLGRRTLLERDVFKRGPMPEVKTDPEEELIEVDLFKLVEAFREIVAGLKDEDLLEISTEKMSLSDRINEIMEKLSVEKSMQFRDLLADVRDRRMMIYTLLAILELMKMRIVRACQTHTFGPIRIFLAVEE